MLFEVSRHNTSRRRDIVLNIAPYRLGSVPWRTTCNLSDANVSIQHNILYWYIMHIYIYYICIILYVLYTLQQHRLVAATRIYIPTAARLGILCTFFSFFSFPNPLPTILYYKYIFFIFYREQGDNLHPGVILLSLSTIYYYMFL